MPKKFINSQVTHRQLKAFLSFKKINIKIVESSKISILLGSFLDGTVGFLILRMKDESN